MSVGCSATVVIRCFALAVQAGCTDWPVVSRCEAEGTSTCAWPSS